MQRSDQAEAQLRALAGLTDPPPQELRGPHGANRRQRRANLAVISYREDEPPGNYRLLRYRHNSLCAAVARGQLQRARGLLQTMPARYRAVVALLHHYASYDKEAAHG